MLIFDELLREYCAGRSWFDIYNSLDFIKYCAKELHTTIRGLHKSEDFQEWLSERDEDAYFLCC